MAALRFRRSVKVAPGVRLNLSKTGAGVSVGTRGARASAHSRGVTTRTVGIPGTGLHWREDRRTGARAAPRRSTTGTPDTAAAGTATGPPSAVTGVRDLLSAAAPARGDAAATRAVLQAARDGDLPGLLGLLPLTEVAPAAAAAATLLAVERGRYDVAAQLARRDVQAELDHPLTVRLLHGVPVPHPLVPGRTVAVPAPLAVVLGGLEAANRTGDHQRVLQRTTAVDPCDVVTASLTLARARACLAAGVPHGALELLAPLARRTSLGATVRAAGYELRIVAFLATGDATRARQDAGRLEGLDGRWPTRDTVAELVA